MLDQIPEITPRNRPLLDAERDFCVACLQFQDELFRLRKLKGASCPPEVNAMIFECLNGMTATIRLAYVWPLKEMRNWPKRSLNPFTANRKMKRVFAIPCTEHSFALCKGEYAKALSALIGAVGGLGDSTGPTGDLARALMPTLESSVASFERLLPVVDRLAPS